MIYTQWKSKIKSQTLLIILATRYLKEMRRLKKLEVNFFSALLYYRYAPNIIQVMAKSCLVAQLLHYFISSYAMWYPAIIFVTMEVGLYSFIFSPSVVYSQLLGQFPRSWLFPMWKYIWMARISSWCKLSQTVPSTSPYKINMLLRGVKLKCIVCL